MFCAQNNIGRKLFKEIYSMRNFKNKCKRYAASSLPAITAIFVISTAYADQDVLSLFPLDNYDQTISTWIKSSDPDFDKTLLSAEMQQKRLDMFNDHYFGPSSPWSSDYVNQILRQSQPDDLKTMELGIINNFSNESKTGNDIGYGENFRPYAKDWIEGIATNINSSQFDGLSYQSNNRGIAIDNLHARALPTDDVHFYSYKIAGQGFPFDNLQMSALWAGTPVYIVGETRDHAWMLVITPDYIAWVKSSGIARTDTAFVRTWTAAAENKLAAITHTQTGIVDTKGIFLISAYVGSVFPATPLSTGLQLMIPVADTDHNAIIKNALVSYEDAAPMPVAATPHNFANIMKTMIGRPYGWGGMYFDNDCSAELKSLFTPFGIWLPRHSSDQLNVGKMVDMTSASQDKRLSYLMENGQRFLTLIYIGGHVILYVGNYPNPNKDSALMAMTYQNVWGLSPNPPVRRAVIGKSVLFPMLLQYPEDTSLVSLAGKKYFQVSYLNQFPTPGLQMKQKGIDLKSLMYPETSFVMMASNLINYLPL